jgi:Domain of unknown function (DUF4261)
LPLSLALIPLSGEVRISVVEMERDLKATWPGTPLPVEFRREKGILTFNMGQAFVAIALMPGAITGKVSETRFKQSWLWPNVEEDLKRHQQHFAVTLESDAAPRERAILLTKLCASVLANCGAALGVSWGEAGVLARKDVFRDLASESLRTSLPTELWIDCVVAKDGEQKSQGYTRGLAALGHPELEAKGLPEPPERLHQRLVGVSRYLVENGPIIQEGDAIGERAGEHIRVAFGESQFGIRGAVMRIVYG